MSAAEKLPDYIDDGFFTKQLRSADPEVQAVLDGELERQQNNIELIASENIASMAVLEGNGCLFTNKYAEGYPGKRYYGGCEYADQVEKLCNERVKALFGCEWANSQPHSGASANQAVYLALLSPGDTILGMDLAHGGHLTHGCPVSQSGQWFNSIQYGVKEDGLIDYDQVEALAKEHKPKLIITGASAYPRVIEWERFRKIADEVGALMMSDIAHYAGLVATGVYPSPIGIADVVTTTTHKTLRGPSGGLIMSNDLEIGKKIDRAVFPGLQGKPLTHVMVAKAVAYKQALEPSFKDYAQAVVDNARALGKILKDGGLELVSGGTDSHMLLVDLRPKGLKGNVVDAALERAGITCNKNAIPNDPEKPMVTSGLRVGTPAGTTRGFGVAEFEQIGTMILKVIDGLAENGPEGNEAVEKDVRGQTLELCQRFPIYPSLY